MKKVCFSWLLLLSTTIFPQKNFEGIITYEGFSTVDSSKFIMKVYYGKNKIRYESVEKELSKYSENSKYIITDIEKGILYTIDTLLETIEIDSLKYKDAEDPDAEFLPTTDTKKILNINARRFNAKAKIEDSVLVVPENNWSIWFAEDIQYVIPELYRNKRSLISLKNGNCLWLEFTISFKSPLQRNKEGIETISTNAVLIEHTSLPDSLFNLPANYTLSYKEHETIEFGIEIEEKEEPPPPPPPVKKTQKPPSKKDTKQKPVKG